MIADTQTKTITIDLFEDFVCPWCRIGRANLGKALQRWQGAPVVVQHRPFILDPTIPPEGNDCRAHLEHKLGDRGDIDQILADVTSVGAAAGLIFNFDRIRYAPNTLRAHRLVEVAPESAREAIAIELFNRHFEIGDNIGDPELLAEIATNHGMDEQIARTLLTGDEATAGIVASMREAQQNGITGVPFFVIDDRFGVSGAQSPDSLLQVLAMPGDEGQ